MDIPDSLLRNSQKKIHKISNKIGNNDREPQIEQEDYENHGENIK